MTNVESDRRRSPRQRAVLAVEIDSEGRKHRVGVSRDASDTGILLATPSRFEVGDQLALTLFLTGETAHVRGRVIRLETNPPSSSEIWKYRLAVAFEEPVQLLRAS